MGHLRAGISANERIIVVPEVVAFGGAERSVLALCRWLEDRSLPYRILMYCDHIGLAEHAGYALPVTELLPEQNPVAKVQALRRFFDERKPSAGSALMSGYQAALHASLAGVRAFHTLMHDTPSLFSDFGRAESFFSRLRRRLSDRVVQTGLQSGGTTIVTSEYLKAEVNRTFGCIAAIARMGGMRDDVAFRPRTVSGTLCLLSVSRLEANKRIDWILRALGELEHGGAPLSQRVDWRFDVVGEGAFSKGLRDICRQQGVESRVHFHGFVDDGELWALFERAHLFLMPARQGYGLPAVEALYRGIPVLLHRESGVSDILRDTPWCVVMEGGEANMRPAMERILTSLLSSRHIGQPLPPIPSEADWAGQVAKLCGWVP